MLEYSKSRRSRLVVAMVLLGVLLSLLVPGAVSADAVSGYNFASPIFGLGIAPDDSLLVADAGAGIVELRKGEGSLVTALPGVADVAAIGRGVMWAVTGGGEGDLAGKLFRVSRGSTQVVADLLAFEANVNPDGGEIDSNPYSLAAIPGKALVADAGANALLVVDNNGHVDWVATFPHQLASTENAKNLLGCPDTIPDLAFVCDLPDMIPAEAVPTSVAVGPDGAYYVGELTGFPGALGISRVWRVEPGTLHAECGSSPACSVIADGFTSIVDLAFGPDGSLYVLEMDEASFLAIELGFFGLPGATLGGTVNVCSPDSWSCSELAGGLFFPTAIEVDRQGTVYAAVAALIPGAAQVITLP